MFSLDWTPNFNEFGNTGFFFPANNFDFREVNPDPERCDAAWTTSFLSGPYLSSDELFDYALTLYSAEREYPYPRRNGNCIEIYKSRFVPGGGQNGEGDFELGGPVCSVRSNGPSVSVESQVMRIKKGRMIRARLMRNGNPIRGKDVKLELTNTRPGSGTIETQCQRQTDSDGYISCFYHAPDRPTVDKIKATWIYNALEPRTDEGTITVTPPTVVLGFFNGVWNTEDQTSDGLTAIRHVVGLSRGETVIRYENFYNQTGRANGSSGAQDIAETFIQRSKELDGVLADRWEHFWEMSSGRSRAEGSLTSTLLSGLGESGLALADLIDSAVSAILAKFAGLLSNLLSHPPTATDSAEHLSRLRALAAEDNDFVLVAHSQGNLFVNLAYDGLADTSAKKAVVHVAPASPTLRGKHVLADIDLVINGLRIFGLASVPANNLWVPTSKTDLSGHTFANTYLDGQRQASTLFGGPPATTPRAHVKAMIDAALDQVAPP